MTIHSCPECGCILTKARSGPDHRRFFGMITKAFEQWPEHHEFQPRDSEVLRAYLLVKSGHFNVKAVPTPLGYAENPAIRDLFRLAVEGTAAAMAAEAGYHDIRVGAAGIEILTPRSIDYRTVSQKEFGPVRDNVQHLIEAALGVPAEQLLRERAA